jgi:hypothetical protein
VNNSWLLTLNEGVLLMKRFMFVLAVGLMFVVSLSSNALPRSQPFDARYPYMDTDEHTWGGENEGGSPGPVIEPEKTSRIRISGFMSFDVFFNTILVKWWLSNDTGTSEAPQNSYYAVPVQHDSETRQPETSTNNKGN